MPQRRTGLGSLWPALWLSAAAATLHVEQLLGQRTYLRDTYRFYVPAKHYLAEVLGRNELPQWWPWDGLGSPFLAQPMFSVFHPTTLLYRVLPFWTAFAAQDLTTTELALVGTYLLARALGQQRIPALLAATLFASCGYMVGLTEHTFMKLSAATMPWFLWSLLTALRRGEAWWLAPAASFGLLLLAGDPQVAILAAVAGAGFALAERPGATSVVFAAASAGAGAVLAAVQVLPSLLLIPETRRAIGAGSVDQWPLDLAHAIGFLVPVTTEGFAFHMCFGLAGLGLAAAALTQVRQSRSVRAMVLLALLSVWLALGHGFGLNDLFRALVPMWSKLRYPIKSIVLAMLMLALLAGHGFQLIRVERSRRAWVAGLVMMAGLTTATALHFRAEWWALAGPGAAVALASLLLPARPILTGTAAGLIGVQALWLAVEALPTVPASFYDEPPLVTALHAEGVGLKGPAFDRLDDHEFDAENAPFLDSQAGGGSNSLYGALFDMPALTSYMPGTALRLRRAWDSSIAPPVFARLAGTLGVGFIVETAKMAASGLSLVGADRVVATEPKYGYTAVHLRHFLPRAYSVSHARAVETPEEAGAILRGNDFKPGREILVEKLPPGDWSSGPEVPARDAVVVDRTNASVTIDAELPADGFVVLNEAYFRGWSATVDGDPADLLVANGFVRGVQARAGRHRVEMRFVTPGLAPGALTSGAGWIAVATAGLVLRKRKRRAMS